MVNFSDIRNLVVSMFVMLNKKTFILFRIEFLVVLVTVLFLTMSIMDIFRRQIHSSVMKAIFTLFDAVSDSIVIYLLGAMQTTHFKNQLFPVWALVLIIFRYSADFISGYGVPDNDGRRFTEWRNAIKLMGSAFLNWTRGSRFARPLWSLWALQILRSFYRFTSHSVSSKSPWHGGSSETISEHMHAENDYGKWRRAECNPRTMIGYEYLVYGESVHLEKPRYVLRISNKSTSSQKEVQGQDANKLDTITRSSLITLDKIWRCRKHLLFPDSNSCEFEDNIKGNHLKDLSLAFALSRLLRCRLEDVKLQGHIFDMNRKLIKKRIIERDAECAFGIMEMQLAFVNDYFNTRYPMVFCCGLYSLIISLLLSLATLGVVLWLSVDIRKVYKPPDGELAHIMKGVNIDAIITWVFMSFIVFKEIWEMLTYFLSDWTRIILVCKYAEWDGEHIRNSHMERLIKLLFKWKITAKRWHGLLDQYVFVHSYDYIPTHWNRVHKVTTGMLPKKEDGEKLSNAVDIPDCVKSEIMEKILAILDVSRNFDGTVSRNDHCLSQVITTLSGDRLMNYGWAIFHLQTCSQVILVWHIATNFCQLALAKKNGINLSKPGFLLSILGCITNCCSSNEYEYNLTKELKEKYLIANRLSSYCGYLLVSKPELIPDSFLVPKMIFRKTVKTARDVTLKDCDCLEKSYNKLQEEARIPAEEYDNVKRGENILKQGALLGNQLIVHEGEEGCWEILAGVWAELLIHIAPTWNAEAHKKCLGSGGEFITNIWALLWHCGIEKSRLWPTEDASEINAPADHQDNNVGNDNINTVEVTQQDDTDTGSSLVEMEVDEEIEILGTEETKANLEIGPREVNSGSSSQIEELSEGMTANDPNVHAGTDAGCQTQIKSELKVKEIQLKSQQSDLKRQSDILQPEVLQHERDHACQ
ncbi:unnamed protein product [Urochloa humidicola]